MTERNFLIIGFLFAATFAFAAESKDGSGVLPDPVLGKWIWRGEHPVTVTPDGKAVSAKGPRATWKFLNNREVERKYEFIWDEGIFIDTMRLTRGGKRLEGKNQRGERIWADRTPAP